MAKVKHTETNKTVVLISQVRSLCVFLVFILVFNGCDEQNASTPVAEKRLEPSAFITSQIEALRKNPKATPERLKKLRDSLRLKAPAADWIALETWKIEWTNSCLGEYEAALRKIDTLEKICSNLYTLSNQLKSNLMILKGRTLNLNSQVNNATRTFLEARDFSEANGDTIAYVRAIIELAQVYTYNNNEVNAYKTLRKAEQIIYNQLGTRRTPPNVIAKLHNRIAAVSYFKGALKKGNLKGGADSLFRHSFLAVKWALIAGDNNTLGSSYNEIGFQMKWPNRYLDMADSAYKLAGNPRDRLLVLYNHAVKLARNGQQKESEEFIDSCIALTKNHIWPYTSRISYNFKAVFFQKRGQTDSALLYKIKGNRALDAEIELKRIGMVADVDAKYELDKKNELIIKQEASIHYQQSRNRAYLVFSVITGSLLIGLFFLFFRLRKSGKRISLQKQQLEKTNRKLSTELSKNETLLAEVHHRVKNNLQIIISLLELQMRRAVSEKEKNQFTDATNRIRSIALVHNMLYNRSAMDKIQFRDYASELIGTLSSVMADDREWDFTIDSADVVFSIDMLVPLGIFLDEAITNSFKYGFTADIPLHITVNLETGDSGYCLRYADNGPGFPAGFRERETESIGIYLLQAMARQLDGDLKMVNRQGAVIELQFTNPFEIQK